MKDANGFYVDVCGTDSKLLERDLTLIRMNVDNFDEAAQFLKDHGFRESKIVPQNYTPISKYAYFVFPSGFLIDVTEQIKKEDK